MTRLNLPAPLLLSLLLGCAAVVQIAEVCKAFLLSFDADTESVIGAAEELKVVLMHEVPYTAETTQISSWMDLDDHDGDGDDDLILNIDPTTGDDGALPVVELRPGSNTSAFEVKVMDSSLPWVAETSLWATSPSRAPTPSGPCPSTGPCRSSASVSACSAMRSARLRQRRRQRRRRVAWRGRPRLRGWRGLRDQPDQRHRVQ